MNSHLPPAEISGFLERTLLRVQKPARYTGGEWNAVSKDWDAIPHHIALAFPDIYDLGMSNLGLAILYDLINKRPDMLAERVYAPWIDMEAELRAANVPLYSLESRHALADFDVIGFSLPYEQLYTNVLNMLDLAGLPLRAADRNHRHPLVVIGGAVTFVNPEPLALFADVIAAGEGEVLVPSLLEAVSEATSRDDLLKRLTTRRGFYIPSFYDVRYRDDGTIDAYVPKEGTGAPPVVKKAALKTTDAVDPPCTSIFTPDTEFGSRFLIEVVRGCANLCRFCWAGYNYLPVRAFPADRILELAQAARAHSSRVGLVSIALCDHPEIERILSSLAAMGYSISPASLRLDDLTPEIVGLLQRSGERTLTIAPETGSDRLRRVINKTVTNDEILEKAELIFSSGIENLKLYYMIGLPTETDEDLEAMRDQTVQLRDIMLKYARGRGHAGRIIGSVNPLVPKPGTSYQWLPMTDTREIERKMKRLHALVDNIEHVYFNIKSERHSYYQALMSLGDRRVAPAIEAAERNGGQWRAAVQESGVDAEFYIYRDRTNDKMLPWDIIDGGMKDAFFRNEFAKGQRAEWTLPPKRQQENARLLPILS